MELDEEQQKLTREAFTEPVRVSTSDHSQPIAASGQRQIYFVDQAELARNPDTLPAIGLAVCFDTDPQQFFSGKTSQQAMKSFYDPKDRHYSNNASALDEQIQVGPLQLKVSDKQYYVLKNWWRHFIPFAFSTLEASFDESACNRIFERICLLFLLEDVAIILNSDNDKQQLWAVRFAIGLLVFKQMVDHAELGCSPNEFIQQLVIQNQQLARFIGEFQYRVSNIDHLLCETVTAALNAYQRLLMSVGFEQKNRVCTAITLADVTSVHQYIKKRTEKKQFKAVGRVKLQLMRRVTDIFPQVPSDSWQFVLTSQQAVRVWCYVYALTNHCALYLEQNKKRGEKTVHQGKAVAAVKATSAMLAAKLKVVPPARLPAEKSVVTTYLYQLETGEFRLVLDPMPQQIEPQLPSEWPQQSALTSWQSKYPVPVTALRTLLDPEIPWQELIVAALETEPGTGLKHFFVSSYLGSEKSFQSAVVSRLPVATTRLLMGKQNNMLAAKRTLQSYFSDLRLSAPAKLEPVRWLRQQLDDEKSPFFNFLNANIPDDQLLVGLNAFLREAVKSQEKVGLINFQFIVAVLCDEDLQQFLADPQTQQVVTQIVLALELPNVTGETVREVLQLFADIHAIIRKIPAIKLQQINSTITLFHTITTELQAADIQLLLTKLIKLSVDLYQFWLVLRDLVYPTELLRRERWQAVFDQARAELSEPQQLVEQRDVNRYLPSYQPTPVKLIRFAKHKQKKLVWLETALMTGVVESLIFLDSSRVIAESGVYTSFSSLKFSNFKFHACTFWDMNFRHAIFENCEFSEVVFKGTLYLANTIIDVSTATTLLVMLAKAINENSVRLDGKLIVAGIDSMVIPDVVRPYIELKSSAKTIAYQHMPAATVLVEKSYTASSLKTFGMFAAASLQQEIAAAKMLLINLVGSSTTGLVLGFARYQAYQEKKQKPVKMSKMELPDPNDSSPTAVNKRQKQAVLSNWLQTTLAWLQLAHDPQQPAGAQLVVTYFGLKNVRYFCERLLQLENFRFSKLLDYTAVPLVSCLEPGEVKRDTKVNLGAVMAKINRQLQALDQALKQPELSIYVAFESSFAAIVTEVDRLRTDLKKQALSEKNQQQLALMYQMTACAYGCFSSEHVSKFFQLLLEFNQLTIGDELKRNMNMMGQMLAKIAVINQSGLKLNLQTYQQMQQHVSSMSHQRPQTCVTWCGLPLHHLAQDNRAKLDCLQQLVNANSTDMLGFAAIAKDKIYQQMTLCQHWRELIIDLQGQLSGNDLAVLNTFIQRWDAELELLAGLEATDQNLATQFQQLHFAQSVPEIKLDHVVHDDEQDPGLSSDAPGSCLIC